MLHTLTSHWWVFAVRGIAAIIFGILSFAVPGVTLLLLVSLFAAYALISGIGLLLSVFRGRSGSRGPSWWVGVLGIIDIGAGILAILLPGVTALTLLYIVAFWSIVTGLVQVATAIRLRREIEGELWMAVGGLVSVVFGIYLMVLPGDGLLSLVWLVALWAIVFGVTSLMLAVRFRQLSDGGAGIPTMGRAS